MRQTKPTTNDPETLITINDYDDELEIIVDSVATMNLEGGTAIITTETDKNIVTLPRQFDEYDRKVNNSITTFILD